MKYSKDQPTKILLFRAASENTVLGIGHLLASAPT